MHCLIRSLMIVIFSCTLLACDENLTSEDHFNNAKVFLENGDNPSAIIELKNALKLDENNTRARSLLGKLYFESGGYEDADKELSRALSTGADPTVVVPVLAQVLLGLAAYERLDQLTVEGLDPQNRSTLQAAKALSMIYRNKLQVAAELMETALQNQPNSPYAQVAAARLSMEQEDYDGARSRLKQVFDTSPQYAPAWNLLGDLESAQRQPIRAERAYTKVINITRGQSFDAQLNRAMMRIYLGNFKGARSDLERLRSAFNPARYHPGVNFAWGLVHLQANAIDMAVNSFEQASEFSDSYPQTLYYLAAIYLEKGLIEQAMSSVYQFLSLVPDSVAGAKLAAKLELGQKGYTKAEKLLRPIVAARPDDIEALNLLASALLAQGKSGEGVEFLSKIVEQQPDSGGQTGNG